MISVSHSATPHAVRSFQLPGLRWWIITVVFLATLINFLNRLTIAVLGPLIVQDLHLSNLGFAALGTWFLAAYTISQGLSGILFDRWGTRIAFSVSVVVWSLAAMAHAFARTVTGFSACRFALGLGEAGNWPGAAKVIAEWFPARQRAFAMAIFNSGAALGSMAAPPLIIWLQAAFSWRATFLVIGSLGFFWLLLWLWIYRPIDKHPMLTVAERQLIESDRGATGGKRASLSSVLHFRQAWGLVLARFLTDPIWWLYITWLPLYLYNSRGFSLKQIGMFAWMPYLAADAGSLLGGWMSGFLMSKGWTVDRARKTVIVAAAAMMCSGIAAPFMESAGAALGVIAVVLFGFQAWINNVQTLPSDLFPQNRVATVAGLGGVGAGIGAMIFTLGTGWVVDRLGTYTPILVTAGLLPIAGTTVLLVLTGRIQKLSLGEEPTS